MESRTECERIIDEGILPNTFLEPEEQCDFLVDEERKKIWAVELDLLLKFDEVCRRYGFKYFLIGGSLLGGVRHKGFIPWDDDIDVAMLREDYEEFAAVAASEFHNPYFFQTPETDKGYFFSFAKLRNSNTTSISIPFRFEHFNQGIGMDIFVLDNARMEDLQERFDRINELILENSANMRRSNPHPSEDDLRRMAMFPRRDPLKVWEEMGRIARKYEKEKTEYVNLALCTAYGAERLCFLRDSFGDTTYIRFEGYLFPAPRGYDDILKRQYGEYMVFPPVGERGNWHNTLLIDPDVPYLVSREAVNGAI